MKRIILPLLLIITSLLLADEVDFLKIAKGQKEITPTCYPLGAMLPPYKEGYLWKFDKSSSSARIALGTVPLKPLHNYKFHWKILPPQFLVIQPRVYYIGTDGKEQMVNTLGHYENSSAFVEQNIIFFTPPNITSGRFELVLWNKKLAPDVMLGYIEALGLVDCGPQKADPAMEPFYGKNLLPLADFSAYPVGPADRAALKLMSFRQKPFGTAIMEENGQKFLRLNYSKGDYQYPAWFTPNLPAYGKGGELGCRMRGKGRVQLMVWYNRPNFPTVFRHYGYFDLTDEWQDYKASFGCNDPLTQKVAFSLSFKEVETQCDLQSIHLEFQKPEQETKK